MHMVFLGIDTAKSGRFPEALGSDTLATVLATPLVLLVLRGFRLS